MDENSVKKSISLETLVIQNITNANKLKAKLHEVINLGPDYNYDISSCIKSLLNSSDQEIVLLSIQAVAELSKCKNKRETYASKDVIEPILLVLTSEAVFEKQELFKQCCRALGNLCCDCDTSRNIIKDNDGVAILASLVEKSVDDPTRELDDIKILAGKAILNYVIGGSEMSKSVIDTGIIDQFVRIFELEIVRNDMDDECVSMCLLIMSVINDNITDFLFEDKVNLLVLKLLQESASLEVTELCLEHLNTQAEHDSVKMLLARAGGLQLVCSRLELLLFQTESVHGIPMEDVEGVMKQACDLVVIVLTGDEAMELLYHNGFGEVYNTMVRWLKSPHIQLLSAAVLAMGNFARTDEHSGHMMEEGIFEKLLDLFETHHKSTELDAATSVKLQHAILSAIRNLLVTPENRRLAAGGGERGGGGGGGRAGSALAAALPALRGQHQVAYKLMGAARMLAREAHVADFFAQDAEFLSAVAQWGARPQFAGAAGEAPRLLATIVTTARVFELVKVEGCVSALVSMLVSSHSIMQNEAILALTLLAALTLNKPHEDFDYEQRLTTDLVKAEIGTHVSVLVETNCAKMPPEVAENLTVFLEQTCKRTELLADYKSSNLASALKKLLETRSDFSDALDRRMNVVLKKLNAE